MAQLSTKRGILLTGATGFLGMHILKSLLEEEKYNIYCLVRGQNISNCYEKIRRSIEYYYPGEADELCKRVIVKKGDIEDEFLGLLYDDYMELLDSITDVIHTAAIVKHFGDKKAFLKTNIEGTDNIIRFCIMAKAYLIFTSSIAVIDPSKSVNGKPIYQDENKADPYVYSKIVSERKMESWRDKGLKYSILRIGAISGRRDDGLFQRNIEENALYARLKTIYVSGLLPKHFLDSKISMIPVDFCGDIVVKVIDKRSEGIFYLYNEKSISYRTLISYFNKMGKNITTIDSADFITYMEKVKKYGLQKEVLSGFYLQYKRKRNKTSFNIKDYSDEDTIFKIENLEWPTLTYEYISKLINSMKKQGYIT